MLPEESNGAFPGHVTEGSLGVSQVAIDVDAALEAVEGEQSYYCLHTNPQQSPFDPERV